MKKLPRVSPRRPQVIAASKSAALSGEKIIGGPSHADAITLLHAIVDAWEALPGGRQVRSSDVEVWLGKHMAPGIDNIRGFLLRPRPCVEKTGS